MKTAPAMPNGTSACFRILRPHDVDTAAKICPVLAHDPGGLDVAHQVRSLAQHNALSRFYVSLYGSGDNHFRGFDHRIGFSAGIYGQTIVGFELPLHFAVDS